MKRVLIITYYWPPSGGSGVQRWVKFSKYLPAEGWQPVIYTPSNPELIATDRTLEAEIPEEVEVIRRRIFEPYGIYRALLGRKDAAKGGSDEVNPANAGQKSLMQRFSMWVRGNFFIPDPRCMWIRPSVRFLKKYLREHPVDLIISTGPPHTMHLIAERVARAVSIPWIADFRDPWTKMFYFKHLSLSSRAERRHKILEKRTLDGADAVVAVSPLVQKDFAAMTQTPVHLITNGYDEEDFEDAVVESDGYFNVAHTGLFASDGNPEILWKVLADKCRRDKEFANMLRIRLTGKTDSAIIASIKAAGLASFLRDNGYQAHTVAVKEQKAASLIIIPLRKEAEYRAVLPGKVFECMASGNPVLGIGQTDGAMAVLLNETGAGKVYDWSDEEGMAAFIDCVWTDFLNANASPSGFPTDLCEQGTLKEEISKYSRKALTVRMAALMNSITDK